MSMSNTTENDILKMSLIGTDPLWRVGANVYLALFTADPTESGVFTDEATFTGYARVLMAKATSWTDGGSTFTNANLVQFPQCTGGTNTITHFAVCTLATAGQILYSGTLNSPLAISNGIQPQFSIGSVSINLD
ncbi:MAG: hypothetical protein QG567_2327 [Campylobacterota bacterium]|nr:hypothetical protein [Campylobacterota bacterium]